MWATSCLAFRSRQKSPKNWPRPTIAFDQADYRILPSRLSHLTKPTIAFDQADYRI